MQPACGTQMYWQLAHIKITAEQAVTHCMQQQQHSSSPAGTSAGAAFTISSCSNSSSPALIFT